MTEAQIKKLAAKKPENRTDADWAGIYDANALAEAEAIKADESRLTAARAWAKVLLSEREAKEDNMRKVANA